MTELARVVITSTGYLGAPGYNIIHASQGTIVPMDRQDVADSICQDLSDAYQDFQSYLVDEVQWAIGPTVQFIDVDSGALLDEITASFSNQVITGAGTGLALDRSACFNVAFRTNDFVNGRRLIGRSFVGPISNNGFTSSGQIDSGVVSTVSSAFDGLISGLGARLAVYHRPAPGQTTGGTYGDVVTVTCRSVPGTLRSRKT